MLATRALTHSVRGNLEEAALWSERAVQSPNAHVQIYTLAAITLELIGNRSKADGYVEHIRHSHPHYTARDFTARFPFRPDAMRRQVAESLRRLGL